jgi:signal transduction histidine kinase
MSFPDFTSAITAAKNLNNPDYAASGLAAARAFYATQLAAASTDELKAAADQARCQLALVAPEFHGVDRALATISTLLLVAESDEGGGSPLPEADALLTTIETLITNARKRYTAAL